MRRGRRGAKLKVLFLDTNVLKDMDATVSEKENKQVIEGKQEA